MLRDLLAWIWPALPAFFFAGVCFVIAGGIWWFAIRRNERPLPRKLASPPVAVPLPARPPKSHAAREDSDTGVMARIPGATPELTQIDRMINLAKGPACPICGGPWHAVCPSKERTEEAAESALVRIPPYAPTWPQFPPGLEPPTVVLRQVPGPSVDELDTLAARHRAPDDCPLTTDEVPDIALAESTPWLYQKERWDTVDLTAKTQRIKAVAP